MSLRRVAGLLAAFGLTVGLIGGGVGAAFQDQVTAQENIDVGTFSCKIVSATPGAASDGIAAGGKSLTFTAPTITSSAAGSAPFSFTVQNTGSITQSLTVSSSWTGNLPGNFSSILATPTAPVALVAAGTKTYDAGIQWTALDTFALGKAGSIKYTVNCDEAAAGGTVIFDNTPAVLPPSLASQAFQAQQTAEWGTQVLLAGTARNLTNAVVTMVTWAPQSDWPAVGTAAGWTHPITINLYNATGVASNLPGTLIKSVTKTFTIPWRPVADPTCAPATKWRSTTDGLCYNGYAFNITFDLSAEGIVAPTDMIVGIAYNTNTWGYSPIGLPGPYESLNVGMLPGVATPAGVQPSVGTFPDPTGVYWNTQTASSYTDGGVAGVGIFRHDTLWGGFEPADPDRSQLAGPPRACPAQLGWSAQGRPTTVGLTPQIDRQVPGLPCPGACPVHLRT